MAARAPRRATCFTDRVQLTIPSVEGDFSAWHQGREWAGVWALDLDGPDARAAVDSCRRALGSVLRPRYERQPHATVGFAGLFAQAGLGGYDRASLTEDLEALRAALPGVLGVGTVGWSSFPMVPHLELACARLESLHALVTREDDPPPFLPHLTCGQYAGRVELDALRAQLSRLAVPNLIWQVRELTLFRYRAADISGPLSVEGRLDLTSGAWHWGPDAVLAERPVSAG